MNTQWFFISIDYKKLEKIYFQTFGFIIIHYWIFLPFWLYQMLERLVICHSRVAFSKSFWGRPLISDFRYFLYYVSSAPKLGGQSHPLMFCLIKISKWNIDSRVENQILGVSVKFERIPFKASSWKIEFSEICNKNVATAAEGLIWNDSQKILKIQNAFVSSR